jgi:predicted RNase H-like nuclease (RuvC/YqgF family)
MLERLANQLIQTLRDRIAILRLQREVNRLKLQNYGLAVDNLNGLRRALETQQRAAEDLNRQIEERDAQIAKLRAEYQALESRQAEACGPG